MSDVKGFVSRKLERFPRAKNMLRTLYHRLLYEIYAEKGVEAELNPSVSIITPAEWAGVDETDREEFFGYYDKTPWSPNGEQAVFHTIDSQETADLAVYDASDSERRIIADTTTWNYQQGAMAQWLTNESVILNDSIDSRLCAKIVSMQGETLQELDLPIQTVHAPSRKALCLNYRRLDEYRSQYGYSKAVDNFSANQAHSEDGIWALDLEHNDSELLLSIAELLDYEPRDDQETDDHWINHIFYSPDGEKCIFMHRWKHDGNRLSRLFLYNEVNDELKLLLDDEKVAHYCWATNSRILVYGKHSSMGKQYYLIDVTDKNIEPLADNHEIHSFGDGHPSYSPSFDYYVTDTYPGKNRLQELVLFQPNDPNVLKIGRFFAPLEYSDSYSCDLHPRWSPASQHISIDSAHTGQRKTYMIKLEDESLHV